MRKKLSKAARREEIQGYLFISPWIIGFLVFMLFPFVFSLYLGLTKYGYVSAPEFVGLANYKKALLNDPLMKRSLGITFRFAAMFLPLELVLSFGTALLLNLRARGMNIYRTIFYLPSVLPMVSVSLLWIWILNPKFGVVNWALAKFGIKGPGWLFSPQWALPALVMMSLWGIGRSVIVYLAGLQNINPELYDAAEVDGAGAASCFRYVTVPMMSPVIFFNLIMGIIGSLQVFAQAFIMTGGGPARATHFYMLYLYSNAFELFKAGYASALAWIMFIVIMFFTLLVVRSSSAWVYYEGQLKGR